MLKEKSEFSEVSSLSFLQASSQDLCILHLAKIFDNKNPKYKTRTLKGLIEEAVKHNRLENIYLRFADNLIKLQKLTDFRMPSEEFVTPNELKSYLLDVLKLPNIRVRIENIKLVRDKYIAHNEYIIESLGLDSFWDDVRFLQDLGSLYLSIIGRYFLHSEYFQFNGTGRNYVHYSMLSQMWWLYEMLGKIFERENLVYWWDNND
ncbi:hypothetical protein B879_03559 [Cecembia lonarensis LW9]|uniref:Uncharacterized protein n=1 Tax=Cecembia lonarensis (strain CCUG 58316 / KCTC 22772 / LW9) TaxID=1225176 RepID=K1L6W7_CECL9|nr:hypothetical protein B879_03559 [Cecembia lonarensis LW9]